MDKYTITISYTAPGRAWDKTLIETLSFESDNPLKDGAKLICEYANEHTCDFQNGLYFRICDEYGEAAKYLSRPTEEGFFIRDANNGDNPFSEYMPSDEEKRYLVCLDEQTNDYKSYTMFHREGSSSFGVDYGRIGGSDGMWSYNTNKDGGHQYPIEMFWFKYYEKIAKGYIDRSEIKDFEYNKTKKVTHKVRELDDFGPIPEEDTRNIMESLISQQRKYVEQNYEYKEKFNTSFNQKAIDSASDLVEKIAELAVELETTPDEAKTAKELEIIALYKDLVLTLPRKIKNVSSYIHRIAFYDKDSDNYICNIIEDEKDLIDNLKDVYNADRKSKEAEQNAETSEKEKKTILEENGLTARTATFKEKFDMLELMTGSAYKASRVLAVKNTESESKYNACKQEMGIKDSDCHLFWHGSKNQNWWSIYKNGLSLSTAAYGMFGKGIYFAPKAEKSLGYTDYNGSYWARGNQNLAYLAVFEVAMGKSMVTHSAKSGFTFDSLKYGCQSVWAKAGRQLYNDECIVYKENQCTIRYIVEVDASRNTDYSIDIKKARNLKFTNVDYENDSIVADVPNFKACTGISTKGVSVCYRIDEDKIEFFNSGAGAHLNETDKEFIKEVFKSKFADDKYQFKELAAEIKEYKYIPDEIQKRINKENKTSTTKVKEG